MDINTPLGMLLFFCLFEVLGGAGVGSALRGILHRDLSGFFFLIWGSGFAGIPLFMGALVFLGNGHAGYFVAQLFVLVLVIATVILLPPDFLQTRGESNSAEAAALVGAVLAMIGGAVLVLNLKEGFGVPLLVGAIFGVIGAALLINAGIRVVREL